MSVAGAFGRFFHPRSRSRNRGPSDHVEGSDLMGTQQKLAQEMRKLADRLEQAFDGESGEDDDDRKSVFNFSDHNRIDARARRSATDFGGGPLWNFAKIDIAERDLREKHLPVDFCEGAAWNILIDLLVCQLEGRPVSVTSACVASRVPSTTALRHISLLVEQRLCQRINDPTDRRRYWLGLSDTGFLALCKFYGEVSHVRMQLLPMPRNIRQPMSVLIGRRD